MQRHAAGITQHNATQAQEEEKEWKAFLWAIGIFSATAFVNSLGHTITFSDFVHFYIV